MARLNARLFARLEEERDTRRRTKIFAFPQQMAALRDIALASSSPRYSRRRGSTSRSCCAASTSRAARRRARRSIACSARSAARFAVAPRRSSRRADAARRISSSACSRRCCSPSRGWPGSTGGSRCGRPAVQLGAYAGDGAARGPRRHGSVGELQPQPRVPRRGGDRRRTLARRAAESMPALRSNASLPRLDAVARVSRFGQPLQRRCAVGDAMGPSRAASLGNAARDAYERELDGALLPQVAGTDRAAAGGTRRRAAKSCTSTSRPT